MPDSIEINMQYKLDRDLVTPAQWRAVMGAEPPHVREGYVTGIMHTQAAEYAAKVGKRLPTEAEWLAGLTNAECVYSPLWEWTCTPGDSGTYRRLGGALRVRADPARAPFRGEGYPDLADRYTGFRCVVASHVVAAARAEEMSGQRIAREWTDLIGLPSTYRTDALARSIDEAITAEVRAAVAAWSRATLEPAVAERVAFSASVLTPEQSYDTLACHTHLTCRREPGDCCAIGSVIGAWDQRWEAEAHRAEEAEASARTLHDGVRQSLRCMISVDNDTLVRYVALLYDAHALASHANQVQHGNLAALRAALLSTRDYGGPDGPDGPCWCLRAEVPGHDSRCLQIRAALADCNMPRLSGTA